MASVNLLQGQRVQGTNPAQDAQGISQLMLALRQAKLQEKAEKKYEASQAISVAMQAASQGIPIDSTSVEKAFKDLGLDVLDLDKLTQPPAGSGPATGPSPGQGTPQAPPSGGDMGNVGGLALAPMLQQLGPQPGGAQAANQPSKEAGKKAPGGGVMSDIMTPQTVTQLSDAARAKMGILAPLYAGAMSNAQMTAIKARHEQMVQDLAERAQAAIANKDPDAARLMGQMKFLADPKGTSMNDAEVRSLLFMAGSDKEKQDVTNFITGAEAPADRAKRRDTATTNMLTNIPGINPEDARIAGDSIANGTPIPMDVQKRISSVQSLTKEQEAYLKLVTVLPASMARVAAQAVGAGLPISAAVPTGMQSIAEKQLGIEAGRLAVEQKRIGIEEDTKQLEMERVKLEGLKLQAAQLDNPKAAQLMDQIKDMALAEKAGVKLPSEVKQNLFNEFAEVSGMEVNEVKHWYGGVTYEFKPKADTGLAQAAAGPKGGGAKVEVHTTPIGQQLKDVMATLQGPKSGFAKESEEYHRQHPDDK